MQRRMRNFFNLHYYPLPQTIFHFLLSFCLLLNHQPVSGTLQKAASDENRKIVKANTAWRHECPHAISPYSKISVTFTFNEAIWLKIVGGRFLIKHKVTEFERRDIGGHTVITASSNRGRYKFYYDELANAFQVEIPNALPEDNGRWECLLTVYKPNGIVDKVSSQEYLEVMGDDWLKERHQSVGRRSQQGQYSVTDGDEDEAAVDDLLKAADDEAVVFQRPRLKHSSSTSTTSSSSPSKNSRQPRNNQAISSAVFFLFHLSSTPASSCLLICMVAAIQWHMSCL